MKYSYSDITQAVGAGKNIGKHVMELSTGCDKGYEYTLSQQYMQEVRDYSVEGDRLRVILISNSTFSARQAYLCLINKFMRRMSCEDDYAELYGGKAKGAAVVEKVQVITDKYFKELFESTGKEGTLLGAGMGKQNGMESFQGDNLLFELSHGYDADAVIDGILEHENRCIAVMLNPGASCEYFVRRLTFEGEFDVLRVGRHSQADYIDCAKRYLDYHGFQPEEEEDLKEAVEQLQAYRGALFTETDVYTLLSKGMEKAFYRKTNRIAKADLMLKWHLGKKSAMELLEEVVGLDTAKETIKRLLAVKRVVTDNASDLEAGGTIHTNMIFAGNPGTGKSKLARLYAKLLSEIGVSNGCFEDVSRADLIGKYVGHTAAKIKQLFERALGGVIFVDEASFLLGDDTFVREAVVEFVRFMELYPETTVIFATYKQEAELLLHVDAGLRSRISRIVMFEDYRQEELYKIMELLAKDYGVRLDENCRYPVEEYIEKIRDGHGFANGREVRKLLECSMEEYGLRVQSETTEPIREEDVSKAVKLLLEQREIVPKKRIGFGG